MTDEIEHVIAMPILSQRIPLQALKDIEGNIIDSFLQYVVECGKQEFLELGMLRPMVNVLGRSLSATQRLSHKNHIYQHSIDISLMMKSEEYKDVLTEIMPGFLQKAGAFCVVIAMESYSLLGPEVKTVYEDYGSIGAHPNSFEALSFTLETTDGMRMELYPIERNGDEISFGESCAPSEMTQAEGRFAGWPRPLPTGIN